MGWTSQYFIQGYGIGGYGDFGFGVFGALIGGYTLAIIGASTHSFWEDMTMALAGAMLMLFIVGLVFRQRRRSQPIKVNSDLY